jgi:galactose-1-phosphate uridylyltransferase
MRLADFEYQQMSEVNGLIPARVVILPKDSDGPWLRAGEDLGMDFMRAYPVEHLQAVISKTSPRAVVD